MDREFYIVVVGINKKRIETLGKLKANPISNGSIKDCLSLWLAVALSKNLSEGAEAFQDWNLLSVYQDGIEISLSEDCSSLRTDAPIVCILNMDESLPSVIAAKFIADKFQEERKKEEMDDLVNRLAPLLSVRLDNRAQIIPISQERHWLASSAVIGLKRFFYKASDEIAKKLSANPSRREEGLTDELVYEIFSNPQNQKFLDSLLSPSGVKIKLECEESGSAEKKLGCDIGMCLTVESKGLNNRRAILLQAKRLHPHPDNFSSSSRYGDLFESHGIEQARKMLAITPCSYFLLYNPSDLHNYLKPYGDEIQINTSLDYSTDGICILPASVMEGMNRLRWQNVVDLHPFTCSFVKFMVDDFIQGKLGDGGRRAIKASLTRKLQRVMEIDDNAEVTPPRFSISIRLDVSHMSGSVHQRNQ